MATSRVHFHVVASTGHGDHIRLVGDTEETGNWLPEKGVLLYTSADTFPTWSTLNPIKIPTGISFRYKYVIFRGGKFSRWEELDAGENRILTNSVSSECHVSDVLDHIESQCTTEYSYSNSKMRGASGNTEDAGSRRFTFLKTEVSNSTRELLRPLSPISSLGSTDSVIVVSFKLPVIISKKGDLNIWEVQWDDGELLSRKQSQTHGLNVTWIGCVNNSLSIPVEERSAVELALKAFRCIPVWIDADLYKKAYVGYCKDTLWPILHNVIDVYGEYPTRWWHREKQQDHWQSYMELNRIFGDKVVEEYSDSGDIIWIHDYELLVLPSFLARRLKTSSIGLFLHTPFPSSEIFRTLSVREEILRGMLQADHIGFHLYEYGRHFLTCCRRIIGLPCNSNNNGYLSVEYGGRHIHITLSFGHVEPSSLITHLKCDAVTSIRAQLALPIKGRKIIASVSTLERLKGIPLQLLAFETFLKRYGEFVGKICYLQYGISNPSRENDWIKSRNEVEAIVNRINTTFGANTVIYREVSNLQLNERLALWSLTDVLLANSIRNGFDLFPMEFVVANQFLDNKNGKDGIIILSEFCGISRVLNGAIRVNPWMQDAVVSAIHRSLTMDSNERTHRLNRDRDYVMNTSGSIWASHILLDIKKSKAEEESMNLISTGLGLGLGFRMVGMNATFKQLEVENVCQSWRSSFNRVILLDFGGTIVSEDNVKKFRGFNTKGATVMIPENVNKLLRELCKDKQNTVFIISGKERGPLNAALEGINGLGMAAEQGFYYRWGDSGSEWEIMGNGFDESWKELAYSIMEIYTLRTNGTFIERKGSAMLWMYRDADPEFGSLQAKELRDHLINVLVNFPVEVLDGIGYVEVRPEGVNKGAMVQRILGTVKGRTAQPIDFVLCIGDDSTDEPMFKAVEEWNAEMAMIQAEKENASTWGPGMISKTILSSPRHVQHYTVTVGKKPSAAKYFVNSSDDVVELLDSLVKLTAFNSAKKIRSLTDLRSTDVSNLLDEHRVFTRGISRVVSMSTLSSNNSNVGNLKSLNTGKGFPGVLAGGKSTPSNLSMADYFNKLKEDDGEEEGGIFI